MTSIAGSGLATRVGLAIAESTFKDVPHFYDLCETIA